MLQHVEFTLRFSSCCIYATIPQLPQLRAVMSNVDSSKDYLSRQDIAPKATYMHEQRGEKALTLARDHLSREDISHDLVHVHQLSSCTALSIDGGDVSQAQGM